MGLSLDGIASGLDTASLISSLMAVEAQPQTLLKNSLSNNQLRTTDFQSLNSKVSALADLAKTSAKGTTLKTFTASSTSTTATVSATTSAAPGSIDFLVTKVASAQTSVTSAMTVWPDNPPKLTIVSSTGVATDISPVSTSLDDVASAINNASVGVTATKVASGLNGSGVQQYRLQLVAANSGAAGAFRVYSGTSSDVTAGTATNLLTATGAATIKNAQDAAVTLWAGTAAEQSVTSTTNTFADLIPGLTVTVSAVSATPITATVSLDTGQSAAAGQNFISSISAILGFIDIKATTTPSKDDAGNPITVVGTFTSDSTIRSVRQGLVDAVMTPVNGKSPSDIGISIDKTGALTFDAAKFTAAQAKDPAYVTSVFTTIAGRVAATATNASDPYAGSLTAKITGQESLSKSYTDQITDWDTRLATRTATLKATFSALEVAMSKLNSQSAYLTSQIKSLPTTSSS